MRDELGEGLSVRVLLRVDQVEPLSVSVEDLPQLLKRLRLQNDPPTPIGLGIVVKHAWRRHVSYIPRAAQA